VKRKGVSRYTSHGILPVSTEVVREGQLMNVTMLVLAAFAGGMATYINNKDNIKLGASITEPGADDRRRERVLEKENTRLMYRAEHAEHALELELAAHKKLRRTLLQKAPEVLKAIDAEEEERKRQELEDGD